MSQSLFTVSIYDTLGPDTTEFIINHSSLACVVTSLLHIPTLLKLAPRIPTLKIIISMDPLDAGEQPGNSKSAILNALAKDAGISIHYIKGMYNPDPAFLPWADASGVASLSQKRRF